MRSKTNAATPAPRRAAGQSKERGSASAWALLAFAAGLGVWSAMWTHSAIEQRDRARAEAEQRREQKEAREALDWARMASQKALSLSGAEFEKSLEGSRDLFEPKAFERWSEGLESLGMRKALESAEASMRVSIVRLETGARDTEAGEIPFRGCAMAQALREGDSPAGWLSLEGSVVGGGEEFRLASLKASKAAARCESPANYLSGKR